MQSLVYWYLPFFISLLLNSGDTGAKLFKQHVLEEPETRFIGKDAYAQKNELMHAVYGLHLYVEYVQVGKVAG